jgi:hypothetical protein
MTPAERTLRARAAAHSMHAQGKTNTHAARAAAEARFERLVDPDGVLTPEERRKRAINARQAHMASIALKSAAARRRRSA